MGPPVEIMIEDDPACMARRLRLWRDVVGDQMADVDLSPAGDLPPARMLRGRLRLRRYEGATIARIEAGAQRLARTRERIARSNSEFAFVNVVTAGGCQVQQHGRRDEIGPGGLCVYDTAAPYTVETSPDFESVLVGVSRDRLERMTGELRSVTGALPDRPESRVAARYWLALADEIGDMEQIFAEEMIEAGLDVLATAIRGSKRCAAPTHDAEALRRARRAILRDATRPGFSSHDVAIESGLSLRRLQELFRADGDAIAAALLRARLAAARRLIEDPRLAALPIKLLMARAGFGDAASFNRAFRRAYGESPAAFRAERLGAGLTPPRLSSGGAMRQSRGYPRAGAGMTGPRDPSGAQKR